MKAHFNRLGIPSVLLLAGAILATGAASLASQGQSGKTLRDLQRAYVETNNDRAAFTAYAQQADKEGYTGAASLFRAAALSEEVHAKAYKRVIGALGGKVQAGITKQARVRSTYRNLEAAANLDAAYTRDILYPKFIKQAEKEQIPDAVKEFKFAKEGDAQLFVLFHDAMVNLNSLRDSKVTYYVCTVCGYTSETSEAECPDCGAGAESYREVR